MGTSKTKKIFIYFLTIFLIFSPIIVCNYSQNEIIDKEIKIGKRIKPLDQEGDTYRLVTSADNVQVPVPKGYVASNVAGENYVTPEYQHTPIPHKGNYVQLNWSSPTGETYPWTQDENGIWISGNQGIPESTSTLESEEFDYIKETTLTINYTYSSQYGDFLNIELINITNNITQRIVSDKYGNTSTSFDYTTSNYSFTMDDWSTGRYKLRVIYKKNSSTDEGQDSGYIKPSTFFKEDENETQTFEEDEKTKIHDGGFVIYQLTDEELEIDPNGTSIVINDTNKDREQQERNQYVWVPVPNIEDIVRTKEINNGIMQFGQEYIFRKESITKKTDTSSEYNREPRLVERIDKTKYYLQRYSNINKRDNFLYNMQEDYARMIKSIKKYKGFYIGRYETGDDYEHDANKGCFIKPKIVRYNGNINYVTWYNSYKALERLSGKTEKYVETGMLHNSLWDYTLKWLNETDTRGYEDISVDSGTWGNFIGSIKTVSSGDTSPAKSGAIETIIYKGETYSDSPTSSNNIFDLAGNLFESTRSFFHVGGREQRGGNYTNSGIAYSANSESYSSNQTIGQKFVGTRAQLYIL